MNTDPALSARSLAMEALSENVVVARARARMSQAELAERAGLSRATVSKIEGGIGDANVTTLERLAAALGCGIADLFTDGGLELADEDELARRATLPPSRFIDAETLLDAVEEAGGRERRYSKAGRPRLAR